MQLKNIISSGAKWSYTFLSNVIWYTTILSVMSRKSLAEEILDTSNSEQPISLAQRCSTYLDLRDDFGVRVTKGIPDYCLELQEIPTSDDVTNFIKNDNLIKYFKNGYSNSHWARHIPVDTDKNFIAALEIYGVRVALVLNSHDARGYRAIVKLVNEKDMSSTFNRNYSIEEELALTKALCILSKVYKKFGIIAQTEIAGNNAQSLTKDGFIQLGNEKEPSLLHGHIIGRGNPITNYIAEVPLRGPKAGGLFNMRGNGNDPGNESKQEWQVGEMEAVADALAIELTQTLQSSPALADIEIVSIRADAAEHMVSQYAP